MIFKNYKFEEKLGRVGFGEKFLKFKVPIKGSFLSTDRQTDGRKEKNNMSPDPEGERHNQLLSQRNFDFFKYPTRVHS